MFRRGWEDDGKSGFSTASGHHVGGEAMGLLDGLKSLFSSKAPGPADDAIHVYVECAKCKATVHVRLDKRHDLSAHEGGGYFVRKEIMDSKCFRLMSAEITLDANYRVESQEIQGGRFLTKEEFDARTTPGPERPAAP